MPPRKDFKQPRESELAVRSSATTNSGKEGEKNDAGGLKIAIDSSATTTREHPMKKMQAKSHDGHGITLGSAAALKLNRSNDLLTQSSTETLLDMLKAHAGIKECEEDTVQHINGVRR